MRDLNHSLNVELKLIRPVGGLKVGGTERRAAKINAMVDQLFSDPLTKKYNQTTNDRFFNEPAAS
jgi:hypothetical protein